MRRALSCGTREVGIEKVPCWRPSTARQSCGVFSSPIGHLVEGAPARPFFLVGVANSSESPQIIDFDAFSDRGQANFHLGRSDLSLEAARKSQKCARQADLGRGSGRISID
jgi:hypothetical protein